MNFANATKSQEIRGGVVEGPAVSFPHTRLFQTELFSSDIPFTVLKHYTLGFQIRFRSRKRNSRCRSCSSSLRSSP